MLYTPETLAERWQVSTNLIRQMLRDGRLSARIEDGLTKIDPDVVEQVEAGKKDLTAPARRKTMPWVKGYVYFVKSGDAIKIGFSRNPDQRMSGLATGAAQKIEVLALVTGTRLDEGRAHADLKAFRLHREWFKDCPEVRAYMNAMVARESAVGG